MGRAVRISGRHRERELGNFACGGDGFWAYADPSDPDYIYCEYQGGYLDRVNRHTHESRDIQPEARRATRNCAGIGTRRSR